MIILKIDTTKSDAFLKLLNKTTGTYIGIEDRLQNWLNHNIGNINTDIITHLKKNINKIIISKPEELEKISIDFESKGFQTRIYNNSKITDFGKELLEIFNYKSFRKGQKAVWFSNQLNSKSCIICNTQYMLITKQKSKTKLLFHLDHYFPKSVYPYLSLSYYNLIPCCSSCNTGKSDIVFKLNENIHPYIDNFHELAKFKIEKSSLLEFLLDPNKNEDKINIKTEIRHKYFGKKDYEKKFENYIEQFKIDEQYSQFKDVAGETYLKSIYYNNARRKELKSFSNDMNLNDELINRFILGNYHLDKDLLKRPLAKFMKDIGEDIKLI